MTGPTTVEWDCGGDCENPKWVELWGRAEHRPLRLRVASWEEWSAALRNAKRDEGVAGLGMWVPCRRCRRCLARRATAWRYRAQVELAAAPRTWFGTITMNPQAHYAMQMRRDLRLLRGGTSIRHLSVDEQWRELCVEGGRELTLWLKRVRKESAAPLRYLLVTEAHKSGLPHWHCFIHEVKATDPVRHRTLDGQWPHGFTRFQLVEPTGSIARYVCKYLSKSALTRVRASVGYGRPDAIAATKETA